MNRWKPQQVILAVRLAIVLAVAMAGGGLESVDGWTWIDSETGTGWTNGWTWTED